MIFLQKTAMKFIERELFSVSIDYDQQEIDLIEVHDNQLDAFEIKWGTKPVKIPVAFRNAYPEASFQIINPDNYLTFIT